MYFVYAIKSVSRHYIYVGLTNDLDRRLHQHNTKQTKSNKAYAPFILIYNEQLSDRVSARIREKYLKSGIGKEFLKTLVK